jgi:hypothetical protein
VAARAAAFADPEVIRLASESFLPLAENCSPLQTQQDAKGEFFRLVAEQGHYAGRTVPSATRQGQYAFTPDGQLLASINTRDADKMLGMMRQALERWHDLRAERAERAEREAAQVARAEAGAYERDPRYPDLYPTDGLVLKQTLRDLPRPADHPISQVRPEAINFDYAWFTRDDVQLFLPERLEVGERRELPWRIVRRLARFHLLDSVRGETPAWRDEHVVHGRLTTEVTRVDGPRVHLTLEGSVLNQQAGAWPVRPFRQKWDDLTRGYDCALRGELVYDTSAQRFTRFDLVAAGDRWGGTEHNNRQEDQLPAPMGIRFELARSTPADRTPPHANLWDYFDIPPDQRPKQPAWTPRTEPSLDAARRW